MLQRCFATKFPNVSWTTKLNLTVHLCEELTRVWCISEFINKLCRWVIFSIMSTMLLCNDVRGIYPAVCTARYWPAHNIYMISAPHRKKALLIPLDSIPNENMVWSCKCWTAPHQIIKTTSQVRFQGRSHSQGLSQLQHLDCSGSGCETVTAADGGGVF